jgi:hypothetical protein
MRDQRGMMVEKFLVPAVGLLLLAVGVPALVQGHWLKGLLCDVPGLAVMGWMVAVWWKDR